jgi:fumarate hydratase class I
VRAVIGKGGKGARTLAACREHGCVYLRQFGSPEAVWELHVRDFPPVVTMDSHGRSLHQEVADDSRGRLEVALKEPAAV